VQGNQRLCEEAGYIHSAFLKKKLPVKGSDNGVASGKSTAFVYSRRYSNHAGTRSLQALQQRDLLPSLELVAKKPCVERRRDLRKNNVLRPRMTPQDALCPASHDDGMRIRDENQRDKGGKSGRGKRAEHAMTRD